MKVKHCIMALASVLLILAACSKESVKTLYSSQETRIESLVKSLISADTTGLAHLVNHKGCQRVILKQGIGDTLTASGTVSFYYAGFTLPSTTISISNMFDTNIFSFAKQANRDTTDLDKFQPVTRKLSEGKLVKGLKNGLIGVRAGEDCYVLFSGKYGFGSKGLGTIPANSALAYALHIVEVSE